MGALGFQICRLKPSKIRDYFEHKIGFCIRVARKKSLDEQFIFISTLRTLHPSFNHILIPPIKKGKKKGAFSQPLSLLLTLAAPVVLH